MPGSDRSRNDAASATVTAARELSPSSLRRGKPRKLSLPSGRVVTVSLADPNRPWELDGCGGVYQLVRKRRGDSTQIERYKAGQSVAPLTLDEADAKALAQALNANLPPRLKHRG
jgi:hypothetical protein